MGDQGGPGGPSRRQGVDASRARWTHTAVGRAAERSAGRELTQASCPALHGCVRCLGCWHAVAKKSQNGHLDAKTFLPWKIPASSLRSNLNVLSALKCWSRTKLTFSLFLHRTGLNTWDSDPCVQLCPPLTVITHDQELG